VSRGLDTIVDSISPEEWDVTGLSRGQTMSSRATLGADICRRAAQVVTATATVAGRRVTGAHEKLEADAKTDNRP